MAPATARPLRQTNYQPPAAARRLQLLQLHLTAAPTATAHRAAALAPAAAPMTVTNVEVRAVGPDVARFRWDDTLPEFFCTNTVVRVRTACGLEGVRRARACWSVHTPRWPQIYRALCNVC